jgi:hypothetical protein
VDLLVLKFSHDSNCNPTFTYLSGEPYRLSRASGYNQLTKTALTVVSYKSIFDWVSFLGPSLLVEFTGNLNKKSIKLILKRISNCKSEKI